MPGKHILLLATFLTSATVAAFVRSFVVSEKSAISGQPDISGKLVVCEKFTTPKHPATSEGPSIPEQFSKVKKIATNRKGFPGTSGPGLRHVRDDEDEPWPDDGHERATHVNLFECAYFVIGRLPRC